MTTNSYTRFSGRTADYDLYRPEYPSEIVSYLSAEGVLRDGCKIADVACGTGKFAKIFLQQGYVVTGVEPNDEMRARAHESLGNLGLQVVNGVAEQTTLESQSYDLITVAQAFHWFDPKATRQEFKRVLRGSGFVVLAWNTRKLDNKFGKGFEKLLVTFCPEYESIKLNGTKSLESVKELFKFGTFKRRVFSNEHKLNFDGLLGFLRSASYVPNDEKTFSQISASADLLFKSCQQQGVVTMELETEVFVGQLGELRT